MSGTFEDVQDADQGLLEGVFGISFYMAISVVTALIMLIIIREYYVRKYQVDICPMLNLCPGRARQEQCDRALAEELQLQRQLDLEQQEPDLEARRKDRREWYEYFIKSYTMVSQ
jgi:hypothetical protein